MKNSHKKKLPWQEDLLQRISHTKAGSTLAPRMSGRQMGKSMWVQNVINSVLEYDYAWSEWTVTYIFWPRRSILTEKFIFGRVLKRTRTVGNLNIYSVRDQIKEKQYATAKEVFVWILKNNK